jgi:hypothetical protein
MDIVGRFVDERLAIRPAATARARKLSAPVKNEAILAGFGRGQ